MKSELNYRFGKIISLVSPTIFFLYTGFTALCIGSLIVELFISTILFYSTIKGSFDLVTIIPISFYIIIRLFVYYSSAWLQNQDWKTDIYTLDNDKISFIGFISFILTTVLVLSVSLFLGIGLGRGYIILLLE